jgi:beta-glucosidase
MSRTLGLSCAIGAITACGAVAMAQQAPDVHLQSWPEGPRDVLIRPEVESFVEQLLGRMSLEEKVGQMIQADIDFITPAEQREYRLGSILAGGNAAPGHNIRAAPGDWLALTDAFGRATREAAGTAHGPIPILFGIDAVHGHARIGSATIFPHNVGLGAAHDAALMERIGAATAEEVQVTGIDWAFAPTVAVVRDPRWGRSYESYSEDPQLVAAYSAAMITGLQGRLGTPEFMGPDRVFASVKHYLGDGGTIAGRDQFNNPSDAAELLRVHAAGYPPAIAAGALTVMASYNSWQGLKMHANHALLTDVLKGRLGFNGFVVGDWNAQEEIPGCTKYDCPAAILAGVDMLMAPDSWRQLYANTLAEAKSGVIPAGRIDDAVRRILRVKKLGGLFDRVTPAERRDAGHFEKLGDPAHRALAREAVRKSLVLLKNDGGLLPLAPNAHVLVVGRAADDIGQQCGGWTVDWQGDHNSNADFPGATSIFGGIQAAVAAAGGSAQLSIDGDYALKPDVAIVVFGELPYAEFEGDRETLEYSPGDASDLKILRKLHAAGVPVVAVFLSGRPLWVNPELNAADAFVAAWLPGSEGAGVADVLFRGADGRPRFDFTGRLGFSWPATVMPAKLSATDAPTGALFERGYGLDYARSERLARLPEVRGAAPDRNGTDVLYAGDHVTAPWSLSLFDAVANVRMTTPTQVSPAGTLTVTVRPGGFTADWNGAGEVQIGGKAVDLRARAAGTALRMRYRTLKAAKTPVHAIPRCNRPNCGAATAPALDVTPAFATADGGSWRTLELPLSCFVRQGAGLGDVTAPFALVTGGTLKVEVSDLRYVKSTRGAKCPRPR